MSKPLKRGEHLHHTNWEPKTESQKKWKEEKEKNPTKIILVKCGLFYEVFNQDADVFTEEFNTEYMLGDMAWTGFPQTRFEEFCQSLTAKGYEFIVMEAERDVIDHLDLDDSSDED